MSPDLIAQLVDPAHATLSAGSNTEIPWRCTTDARHVWTASPNTRKRSKKCPVCINKVIITGVNDLASTHPDLAAQLVDPAVGRSLSAGSHTPVTWRCQESHRWDASPVSRSRLGSGCPYCSGRLPVPGVNDLATTHPDLAAQLIDPALASTVGPGSSKALTWRCAQDSAHTWDAPVRNRARKKNPTGCPVCAGRGNRGYTRRPTLGQLEHPLLREAVDSALAASLTIGSGRGIEWDCRECQRPHRYTSSVRKRVSGQGCPIRAGRQVVAGMNDLATTHPTIAAQLVDQALAQTLSRGSEIAPQWRCEKGHLWQTAVYARVAGNGCPTCTPIGSSYGEQELLTAVRTLDADAQHRARIEVADRKIEVDILVGDLAIEFNGLFWHSTQGGRASGYHRDKLRALRSAGLSLITVWEDQWIDPERRAIVLRLIAHRMRRADHLEAAFEAAGIAHLYDPAVIERHGARTLELQELTGAAAEAFFDRHHIQGAVRLTRAFGLVDDGGAVRAVLGLRSAQHNARAQRRDGDWEIQRYATAGTIPGGFTRLLHHARAVLDAEGSAVKRWVTISADEISDGALYAATGFEIDGTIPPSYWYSGGHLRTQRAAKEGFQLKRFRKDPALRYEEGWTEHEAATANKLYRVYDAGKTRWTKDAN